MSYDRLRQFTHNAVARVEGADFETGVVPAVLSTGDEARDGARILQNGWELDNFRANPLVLFNHDDGAGGFFGSPSDTLPLGRWADVKASGGAGGELRGVAHFDMTDEFAMRVLGKAEHGLINATSVRWLPIEHRIDVELRDPDDPDSGTRSVLTFVRQELLEASFVVIPADPGAVILRGDGKPLDLAAFNDTDEPPAPLLRVLDEAHALVEGSVFTEPERDSALRLYAAIGSSLGTAELPPSARDEIAGALDGLAAVMRGVAESVEQRKAAPDPLRLVARALASVTGRSEAVLLDKLKETP